MSQISKKDRRLRRAVNDPPAHPRAGRGPPVGASHAAAYLCAAHRCHAGAKVLAAKASTVQDAVTTGPPQYHRQRGGGQGRRPRHCRAGQGCGYHQGRLRPRRVPAITVVSNIGPTPLAKRALSSRAGIPIARQDQKEAENQLTSSSRVSLSTAPPAGVVKGGRQVGFTAPTVVGRQARAGWVSWVWQGA